MRMGLRSGKGEINLRMMIRKGCGAGEDDEGDTYVS